MEFFRPKREELRTTDFSLRELLEEVKVREKVEDALADIAVAESLEQGRDWGACVARVFKMQAIRREAAVRHLLAKYGEETSLGIMDLAALKWFCYGKPTYLSPVDPVLRFTDIAEYERHVLDIMEQLSPERRAWALEDLRREKKTHQVGPDTEEFRFLYDRMLTKQAQRFLANQPEEDRASLEAAIEEWTRRERAAIREYTGEEESPEDMLKCVLLTTKRQLQCLLGCW